MTLVVPYDDSDLSKAALVRAAQFDTVLQEGVIVVTVIPRGNETYARERSWLGPTDPFDMDEINGHGRERSQRNSAALQEMPEQVSCLSGVKTQAGL